jgi:hypothetical protein
MTPHHPKQLPAPNHAAPGTNQLNTQNATTPQSEAAQTPQNLDFLNAWTASIATLPADVQRKFSMIRQLDDYSNKLQTSMWQVTARMRKKNPVSM